MNPGMDEKKRKEEEFAQRVDDLLAGKQAQVDEAMDEDYRSNINFSKKIIECRGEPSDTFQEGLKKRLLSKLAEKENAEARRRSETISFWEWLKNLVPQSPTWRTAAVTVTIAVVALVVVWRIGLFSPGESPIVTGPLAPTVLVETRASTPKTVYTTGEEIDIQFTFKNIADEAFTFPFPPEIRIGDLGIELVRTFEVGQGTLTLTPGQSEGYDLTWNQKDDIGKQVPTGDYQIIIPNVQLGEGKGVVSLVESPILTITSNP
jgi:hypothetical protein